MSAFFSNDEPPDKVMQVHVSSVDIIKDFKYYDIRISDTYRSNNKNQHQNTQTCLKPIFISKLGIRKKILKKKETMQKFEVEAIKKAGIGIGEEIFVILDSFVNRRLIQKTRKCINHS